MRLNNKGFAITAVIYGLLILFVILVSSYMTILSARKNRVDNLEKDIYDEYIGTINNGNSEPTPTPIEITYTITLKKYVDDSLSGNPVIIEVAAGGSYGPERLSTPQRDFQEIICSPSMAVTTDSFIYNGSGIVNITFENVNTDSICEVYFD